jgi:threonyl-tRNA synthetase
VAAKINGRYVDLSAEIAESGLLEAIDGASEEGLDIIRHSAAHLMAQAFQSLFSAVDNDICHNQGYGKLAL